MYNSSNSQNSNSDTNSNSIMDSNSADAKNKYIVHHVRVKNNKKAGPRPVATIVAKKVVENGVEKVEFGCSFCNEGAGDTYKKKEGVRLALQKEFKLPACYKAALVIRDLPDFVFRAEKYFRMPVKSPV